MSGRSNVPASRRSAFGAKVTRSRRGQRSRGAIDDILQRRDRLMAELVALRERGQASKFVDNAQQLLTRAWSAASWGTRESLLGNADWLVRLEKRREDSPQSPA
jgi:hypothetical protein